MNIMHAFTFISFTYFVFMQKGTALAEDFVDLLSITLYVLTKFIKIILEYKHGRGKFLSTMN